MTQYECTSCGQLGRFTRLDDAFVATCPVCEEQTHWTVAFEGEGVSFE
jgi:rubredoxin